MKIEILEGTEQRLYDIVAKLVMDPKVLRQNDNVAFKTTAKHVWIVAINNEECVGFLPIQKKKFFGEINNYYIIERDKKIFTRLLERAEQHAKEIGYDTIIVITQKSDYEVLVKRKYEVEKAFVKYTRFIKKL
jgi:N-acetylglutamate synthase-like GNAT family acetyltransferase